MNKPTNLLLLTILIFLSVQGNAHCRTDYSLHDLIKLANTHSETIKIAEDDVDIARQEEKRALSVLIPRATTYGSITEYKEETLNSPDSQTVGIKLTQSFTLNGKELIALDVTRRSIESKEFSLESIRSQYILQVAQAYYNILSARKFFEIAQSDVERLTTHRNAVKEKLSVGNVTKTDLFRAEAELSKALTEQKKAENAILQSKAALHNLVEIDPDFDLQKQDIAEIENYQCNLEELLAYALKNRTEIKEAKKNLEIAEKTVKFKKSDYWPTVELEGGYKETDIQYDTALTAMKYDTEETYVTGSLVFTLYDGGLRRATIRQALLDQKKAEKALILQEKKISLDSKTSFLDYETAKSTLDNLQDELKYAEETFSAVQMQYNYGMADSIDIMDANTLLVSAQRRISDARYKYYLSVLRIMYTKGDLLAFFLGHA
ncbi:MAG: TolC family protein [Desulfobacteraceae bacterium]|nr:TolC family protein [Desulfobacteraceae bacterium]